MMIEAPASRQRLRLIDHPLDVAGALGLQRFGRRSSAGSELDAEFRLRLDAGFRDFLDEPDRVVCGERNESG
jgi:hypothetical protein